MNKEDKIEIAKLAIELTKLDIDLTTKKKYYCEPKVIEKFEKNFKEIKKYLTKSNRNAIIIL